MHSAMEQTRYWMWTRRKLVGKPLNFDPSLTAGSSFGSWEEKAFAADSAGHLGGSIWPPRSYSCSFCAREFRSAQALGGHMNVHRRDRARLKQSTSPVRDDCYSSYHHLNPCTTEGPEYQTQVCPLVYNPNPNTGVAASPLSSKVSMVSSQEKFSKHTSIFQEGREKSLLSNPRYLKDMIAVRQLGDAELKLGRGNWRLNEVGCRRKRNPDEDEDEAPYRKRNKMDSVFPTVARPTSAGQQHLPSEVLKLGPDAVEELDLELRLGDRPTVK